jgi:hypothetical protein
LSSEFDDVSAERNSLVALAGFILSERPGFRISIQSQLFSWKTFNYRCIVVKACWFTLQTIPISCPICNLEEQKVVPYGEAAIDRWLSFVSTHFGLVASYGPGKVYVELASINLSSAMAKLISPNGHRYTIKKWCPEDPDSLNWLLGRLDACLDSIRRIGICKEFELLRESTPLPTPASLL